MHGRRIAFLSFVLLLSAPSDPTAAGDLYFAYEMENVTCGAGHEVTVVMTLQAPYKEPFNGYSIAVCHDDLVSIDSGDVANGSGVAAMNDGEGPDFHAFFFNPDGWGVGMVISGIGYPYYYEPGELELYLATYTAGNTTGIAMLEFCEVENDEGHTVTNSVVAGGKPYVPETFSGSIEIESTKEFIRGDVNDDGGVGLADVLQLLAEMFAGAVPRHCHLAGDVNGVSGVNIADPIFLLNYLFLGGLEPAAPFPECGFEDLEQTWEECESQSSCGG